MQCSAKTMMYYPTRLILTSRGFITYHDLRGGLLLIGVYRRLSAVNYF
ncbi:hypothetical protein H6G83_21335 [Anabaena azotica FACHB-119]|uniref:Uncharacterized protein n=1 Tax=Anabaena azotica FACHB-119 TaxID=947527 RepID=A0ABR8D7J2_9NOST|nr:hypothetical protein [Anabaena azotica FACHB-119]